MLGRVLGFGLISFLPLLEVEDPLAETTRILVEPHLIDAEFRKAWMPFFCWSGHLAVTSDQFLAFLGLLLPQEPLLHLPRITGRDLQDIARAERSTAGGLDGWAWNEIKALPLPWFSGLAILLEFAKASGVWPQGQNFYDPETATRPSAPGCGDTSKASVSSCSIWGGDHKSGSGVAVDWVTSRSYSVEERRRLNVQSGLCRDKVYRSWHCLAERCRP